MVSRDLEDLYTDIGAAGSITVEGLGDFVDEIFTVTNHPDATGWYTKWGDRLERTTSQAKGSAVTFANQADFVADCALAVACLKTPNPTNKTALATTIWSGGSSAASYSLLMDTVTRLYYGLECSQRK